MNKKEWVKIEGIIDQLLNAPLAERDDLLNTLCENDQDLKEQVLRMLDSMDNSDSFFDQISESKDHLFADVEHEIAGETDDNFIGKTIDNYKITKKIGTGGMGTVFYASRCDGVFDKNVAIKLLRREYAVPAVKLQFKLERQILANLKHPGIARLYDGGIYKGLPYLIMEFVQGKPIDEYCNEKRLTVDQRISLFKSVLEIVRYAHNNLVIHRDLKPENILITEEGDVKILDFGISQLEKETPTSEDQNPQKHFLTPIYASPEQINGENILTSSDIYSLGFLLQKLLTDQLPFDIKNKDINEIRDIKLSERPVRASQTFNCLSEEKQKIIAQNRNTVPKYLYKKLRSDLDQIILKALESDQNKRYSTVGKLFEDLSFYENQLPASACSNSLFYKSSKYLTRNSYPLSLAASLLVVILLASIISVNRVNAEHQIALSEAHKAEEMTGFLIELFEAADPTTTEQDDINVRDLLYHGLDRTDNISDPEIKASMLTVMGDALTKISDFETADPVLNSAVIENINAFGENSIAAADAIYTLGIKHTKNHMWHLALPNLKKAHEIYSHHLDSYNPKVLNSLSKMGSAYLNTGDIDSATYYSELAYQRMQQIHEPKTPELLDAMYNYGSHLAGTGSTYQAKHILYDVIESYKEIFAPIDYRLASPYNRLARIYMNEEEYEVAESYYKQALEISENSYGEDHLFTRTIRMNLVNPLSQLGKIKEAEYHFERNISLMTERFTKTHWRTGGAYGAFGAFNTMLGNFEKADSLYRINLDIYKEVIGADHIWTAYVDASIAANNRFMGDDSEADMYFRRSLEVYKNRYPDFNNDHINQIKRVIRMYENADGDYSEYTNQYLSLLDQ